MDRPIKILFLAANPTDTSRLRLDEEIRSIDQALRQAEFRDKFEIEQHWAVRVIDLQGYLLRHKPDIVHFSGHGTGSGEIILEDHQGKSQPVATRALSQLFSVLKDNIRCVVLNACYSEQQAQAIASQIDCVIGMSQAIGDSAAASFAEAFYQALGYGRDIKTAFALGCLQIDLKNLNEQDTPKLLALNSRPEEIVFVDQPLARAAQPETTTSAIVPTLLEDAQSIDNSILRLVRSFSSLVSKQEISSAYADLMETRLERHHLDDLLTILADRSRWRDLGHLLGKPDMEVCIDDDLSWIELVSADAKLLIERPHALWECNCGLTDLGSFTPAVKHSPCPIHSFPQGKILESRFLSSLVSFNWRGLSILWRKGRELWAPSIDVIYFLRSLDRAGVFTADHPSALDLGCGTGIIGCFLAAQNPTIRRLYFADWLTTPLVYSAVNLARNLADRPLRAAFCLGLNTSWTTPDRLDERFDLLVCNPPYLPILPGFEKLKLASTVAGTDLLEHIISNAPQLAEKVYVCFSATAQPEAFAAAEKAGRELVPIAEPLDVPFRVPQVLQEAEYLEALLKTKRIDVRDHSFYPLWHTLTAYRVK
ncbi:MAG TPA: CHAT domain-containing protein [Anaerolineae bacterium]|nr:CHAT domain-containing protein [Anaerolineae bacterium]